MRNETTPGLRRTTGGSPIETLVRLFLLQTPVAAHRRGARRCPGWSTGWRRRASLEQSVGEVAARLDCRPYAADDDEFWVVSDLTPGLDGGPQRVGADHVLGISAASTSLAQLTIRDQVGTALDLGTGCGVQALHLAGHAGGWSPPTSTSGRCGSPGSTPSSTRSPTRSRSATGRSSSRWPASAST